MLNQKRWFANITGVLAIAGTLLFIACSGEGLQKSPTSGTVLPPPPADVTAPTVVITDDVPGATATGNVTFTFTFSEAITTGFDASRVTVTGGTKGTFTRVSATVSTLVVVPTAAATGTINVSVAAGAFTDLSGLNSTVAATASQDYDTTVVITLPADLASLTTGSPKVLLNASGTVTPNIVVDTWTQTWSNGAGFTTNTTLVSGKTLQSLSFTNVATGYEGVETIAAGQAFNITATPNLHLTFYSETNHAFGVKVVDIGGVTYTAPTNEIRLYITPTVGWNEVDLDCSTLSPKLHIGQLVFISSRADEATLGAVTPYTVNGDKFTVANLYFH